MADLKEKDLYDHSIQTYRYFLDWRAKLLAGYFAVLTVLAYSFAWLCQHKLSQFLLIAPVAGFVVTVFFSAIEQRNREQYRDCMNVGRRIEEDLHLDRIGIFTEMHKRELMGNIKVSHSKALDRFYWAVALVCLAVLLLVWPGMPETFFRQCAC